MKMFPGEFSELLTPAGKRLLKAQSGASRSLLIDGKKPFAILDKVIDKQKASTCMKILDEHLYGLLAVEQKRIPPESITSMKRNYSEVLEKTMHVKTAFFLRRTARSYQAAERLGLIKMMRSESFVGFAESLSGFKLTRDPNLQVICYEQGDYVGPHNDHHPENESIKDGFIDFHVMFANNDVAHQYLVYEEKGHFSKSVNVNIQGGVSIYKLPFWHYTTPLVGKAGREQEARRWLLLGSYKID